MPVFKKEILPVGKYVPMTKDGTRVIREFTEKDIREYANTGNCMLAAGLKIPAPFNHDAKAFPGSTDAFNNAGYWTSFVVEKNATGKQAMFGLVDAVGDISDVNTPAGKIGTSVKEVSIHGKETWTDGLGRTWNKAPLHIALCLNPVVPGQSNFELQADSFALSMDMACDEGIADISNLRNALKENNIFLPENVTLPTLASTLLVALKQIALTKVGGQDDQAKVEPIPVYFSLENDMPLTEAQAKILIDTKAVNPTTKTAFTMEDFGFKKVESKIEPVNIAVTATPASLEMAKVLAYAKAVTHQFYQSKKNELKKRLDTLLTTGRINKAVADKLTPAIEGFQMSLGEDATLLTSPLESTLEAFEALPLPAVHKEFSFDIPGVKMEDLPIGTDAELSKEDAEALSKFMLSNM